MINTTLIEMIKVDFISAIHKKKKVRIAFFSKQDSDELVRKCAPMDYGPSRLAKDKIDRFHFWEYEYDIPTHLMSLNPDQIVKLEILDESFDPSEFITWDLKKSPWFVSRDWGIYS